MRTILVMLGLLLLGGCTEQIRAKSFGGSTSTTMPQGQKVVCATWKDADLWILTRPMRPDEKAETLTLRESSSWGVMRGQVTIVEQ
jgi:hypothetical protein